MDYYEGAKAEVYLRSLNVRIPIHQIYADTEEL